MQKIINYFKDNPKFTMVLLITLAICLVVCVAIAVIRKNRFKKVKNDSVDFENVENNFNNDTTLNEETNNGENAVTEVEQYNQTNTEEQPIEQYQPDLETNQNDKVEIDTQENKKDKLVEDKPEVKTENQDLKTKQNVTETQPENESEISLRYAGKWVIYKEDNRFVADLKASNGEKMLSTESYTSLSGIKSGIDTLKKNIANENYAINLDKNGNYVFKIFSTANRLLCIGEGYSTKDQCEKAFASVKRFSKTATIVNQSDLIKE